MQYDGFVEQPGDPVLVRIDVPANAKVRAHLSYPARVQIPWSVQNDSSAGALQAGRTVPFRVYFSGIDTGRDPAVINPAVRRFVDAYPNCPDCEDEIPYAGLANPGSCSSGSVASSQGEGSSFSWSGEVVELPVIHQAATWYLTVRGAYGAGPFSLFFSRERASFKKCSCGLFGCSCRTDIDYATEQTEGPPEVDLAQRELVRMLQTVMELSDGQYSVSDQGDFTNSTFCKACNDIVFGAGNCIDPPTCAVFHGCTDGFGFTLFYGTPFSYIFLPRDYWDRSGSAGCVVQTPSGARPDTVQGIGQTLAHEWGHYEFVMPDEYGTGAGGDCPATSAGDCCGHSIMTGATYVWSENKNEWCTDANHGFDFDPDATSMPGPSNWTVARGHYSTLVQPSSGTPLPTRFGPFEQALESGWFRRTQ